MRTTTSAGKMVLKELPLKISDSEIMHLLYTKDINWKYINAIKELTGYNDDTISDWLNVSVKTLRSYRQPANKFKDNVKEQVLLLLALIKHGIKIFGSSELFEQWLNTTNFFFDNKNPVSFLNTVTGVRFVDDRLTAMEYGDNV